MSWESQGMALLAASLVRPFALAVAAWVTLPGLRVRHPASQHAVWTAVLGGMLLLPFVSVVVPHWKLPVLAAPAQAPFVEPVASEPAVFTDFEAPAVETARPRAEDRPGGLSYTTLYLAGLFAMATYRVAGLGADAAFDVRDPRGCGRGCGSLSMC